MTVTTILTRIEAPVELCFDLALDVNVHAESAAFSGERLVSPGRTSGLLELGDLVTFEGRHFGIRQRFTAKIIEVKRPHRFVDEMVKGSFKWLRHIHEFHPEAGSTLMRDILVWQAPLGPVGKLADVLFLKRHMTDFVTRKQTALKHLAEDRHRLATEQANRR